MSRIAFAIPLLAVLVAAPIASAAPAPGSADAGKVAALRKALGPSVQVVWPEGRTVPTSVTRIDEPTRAEDPVRGAESFLARHRDALGLSGIDLVAQPVERTKRTTTVRLNQTWRGLPVHQRSVVVGLDAGGRRVRSIQANVVPVDLPADAVDIGREKAIEAALAGFRGVPAAGAEPGAEAVVLAGPKAARAWRVSIPTLRPFGRVSVFVDAASGRILWVRRDVIE